VPVTVGASRAAVRVLLALLLGACATPAGRAPGPPPPSIARDAEILVHAGGRSHFFENRRPHCLAYVLDGEWEFAVQPAALRSTDRRRFVGVVLQGAEALPGPGGDLVSRAITQIIDDTEQQWGGSSVRARVEGFPAFRAGAVLLQFDDVTVTPQLAARMTRPAPAPIGQKTRLPLRVIAPFEAGLVMVVTALDLSDARAIASSLEVTEDPQCWRRAILERFPGVLR
jgi:hypothetical protein